MGMFDSFEVKDAFCPYCDSALSNFTAQSKEFDCLLDHYNVGDTLRGHGEFEMHDTCPRCRQYFQMLGLVENGIYRGLIKGSEYIPDHNRKVARVNCKFIAQNLEMLREKYRGKWLAIHDGKLVAFGDDTTRIKKVVLEMFPDAEAKGMMMERV